MFKGKAHKEKEIAREMREQKSVYRSLEEMKAREEENRAGEYPKLEWVSVER